MSGADRYQEAYQSLAAYRKSHNVCDKDEALIQAVLALAAATALPTVIAAMGDTAAVTEWARVIAPDIRWPGTQTYEPAFDTDGDQIWLDANRHLRYVGPGVRPPVTPGPGWRQLYVQAGGES